MTIVVYRNNEIASDNKAINGYGATVGSFKKCGARLIEGRAYFFGATGETAYAQKFMRWCAGEGLERHLGGDASELPLIDPPGQNDHCTGIVCWDNNCLRFEGNNPPITLTGEFFALGSGDMYAMGACAHGATAFDAVRITLSLDSLSGGDTISFEGRHGEIIEYKNELPA